MKQQVLFILTFATTLTYSAQPTQTGLLVKAGTQKSADHKMNRNTPFLLDNTLADNATLVAERELLKTQLNQLKATSKENPNDDLTAQITKIEKRLAALEEERKNTMTALKLQLKSPANTQAHQQKEEDLTGIFSADLPGEHISAASMLYLYLMLAKSTAPQSE